MRLTLALFGLIWRINGYNVGEASAMYKHMLPLVDSEIRYILGNGIGTINSKGITVT